MEAEGKPITAVEESIEFLTEFDLHLFNEGTHYRAYEKFGAHPTRENGVEGTHFAVWAPNAQRVYVVGDFNSWDPGAHPLSQRGRSGVWAGFIPQVLPATAYHYHIVSWHHSYQVDKTDPFGFRHESPPRFASFVWDLGYEWHDQEWIKHRAALDVNESPMAIYEVHLESWMRVPEQGNRWLTFREAAPKLAEYVRNMGFTHVQLLPIMEHPSAGPRDFDITGYFAPSSRLGTPQDLMFLIDTLHQHGIGVILAWVPGHFPADDEHGLGYFDGTHLFESSVRTVKSGPTGKGLTFDLTRREVRSFLTSAAFYWLDRYHVDGLKIDSASALLHLDYGRSAREYVSNVYGGRENLDGISFLRTLNAEVQRSFPGSMTIVDEQTGWPNLTGAPHNNGLGFNLKWDHDLADRALRYLRLDPLFRKHDHTLVAERDESTFDEYLLLALGHLSVGNGQGSLLSRMSGDEWQRFANLRVLLGYQYLLPGKKLLFMGTEFAQWQDWNRDRSLDWHLLDYPPHNGIHRWVGDLNQAYRVEQAFHQSDTSPVGFEWVDRGDSERSTLSWLRRDTQRREVLLVAINFTPVPRYNFQLGVRRAGHWKEILNSDARIYGGSGMGNMGGVNTAPFSSHGFPHLVTLTLPPLAAVVFKHQT